MRAMPNDVREEIRELYSRLTDEQLVLAIHAITTEGLLTQWYYDENCGCIYGTYIFACGLVSKYDSIVEGTITAWNFSANKLRADIGLREVYADPPRGELTPAERWLIDASNDESCYVEDFISGKICPDCPAVHEVLNILREIQAERAK